VSYDSAPCNYMTENTPQNETPNKHRMIIYFSYNVSHDGYGHNILSDVAFDEANAMQNLQCIHAGDEVEFFLGDSPLMAAADFDSLDDMVDAILKLYEEVYPEATVNIIVRRYILTKSS
jgi:hypothetical protein